MQIQIAQLLYQLPVTQRTLEEVLTAAAGLDEAIESLSSIAKAPNPPFPRHDIEQRANMGRNTMKRQLERAVQNQREHEEQNADRLAQAREKREQESKRREEEREAKRLEEEARRQKLKEDREAIIQRDRELTNQRLAVEDEEKRRKEEEFSVDEETGERRKKAKKSSGKRKKKEDDFIDDEDGAGQADGSSRSQSPGEGRERASAPRGKKRRKLERGRSGKSSKYKSTELVVDSDEDDVPMDAASPANANGASDAVDSDAGDSDTQPQTEEATVVRRKAPRVVDDDEDDE